MKATLTQSATVRLTWELKDNHENWNDACAWAIEQFGLPGEKFVTELTADWMEFKFFQPHDAMIMALRFA
jgi:hypothetical protein